MTAPAKHTPSAVDAFYANPSPAGAVAVAREDHRAGRLTSVEFIHQLHAAERRCEAFDAMLAALRAVEWNGYDETATGRHGGLLCVECHNPKPDGHADDCKLAAALAKAEGKV
jgi:hypothetical protein